MRQRLGSPKLAEASGMVIQIFADDPEAPDRSPPTLFTRGNRRNESDSAILKQVSRLPGKIDNYGCLLSPQFRTKRDRKQRDR